MSKLSQIQQFIVSHLSKKVILIIIGVVVLGELGWAGFTMAGLNSKTPVIESNQVAQDEPVNPSTISLVASKTDLKVGEEVSVAINVSSRKRTDGMDLIIKYDPKLISVKTIDKEKSPVMVNTIYDTYPINNVDERIGEIAISGLTNKKEGVLPEGLFGTIVFQAKTTGKAEVKIVFTKGSTTDTNLVETMTSKDILTAVENLEFNIMP